MATYHGGGGLDRAQVNLELHAVSSADGLCVACGIPGPCRTHEQAAAVFALSYRLPRRVPGATRPELVGARRLGVRGLLVQTG